MDLERIASRVSLTQPLQDRRDYGSGSESDIGKHKKALHDVVDHIMDAIDKDDADMAMSKINGLIDNLQEIRMQVQAAIEEAATEPPPVSVDIDVSQMEVPPDRPTMKSVYSSKLWRRIRS
jgi:thiamine pyrophosphate-dependent acetolactate synthase large subunit-like protein